MYTYYVYMNVKYTVYNMYNDVVALLFALCYVYKPFSINKRYIEGYGQVSIR